MEEYERDNEFRATMYSYTDDTWRWYNGDTKRLYSGYSSTKPNSYNYKDEETLKQNFNEYKRRQKLVLKTEFINNYAISYDESVYIPIELAKASDVLLTFNDIEASFVIAKIDKNTIGISARSIGNIDVEKIMKHFNGGGHRTIAATQIKDTDIEKVKNDLIYYLGGLE